jgi:hypothetical protein
VSSTAATVSAQSQLDVPGHHAQVTLAAQAAPLAVYIGIVGNRSSGTGSSFTRRIEMSYPMCKWSGERERRSFGWNRFAWRGAVVSAGWRLDVSKGWSRKTRLFC